MNEKSTGTGLVPEPEVRLRAADPARAAEPDLVALRAAVDARIDAGLAAERATARPAGWTSWPARAAAVAAVALVVGGGGGYAIGAAGGDAPAGDAIILTGPAAGGDAGAPMGGPEMLGAPDVAGDREMGMGGAADGDMAWPGYYGRTVFRSGGLSTEAGTGTAWGFDTGAAFSAETVRRAAEVLGVPGEPRLEGGVWFVGPTDASAPTVQLYPDGTVSLSYWDPAKDPWQCVRAFRESPEAGGTDGESVAPVEEPCVERDLGAAPQGDAAIAPLRDVMAGLGLDVDSYEFVAEEWSDGTYSYASAYQVLDGRRTGVQWGASFTGAGLQSLNGSTATLVPLGDYELISPEAAVARLSDPRFGSGGGPIGYLEGRGPDETMMSEPSWEPTLPATPSAGSTVRWPVDEVTIVEARLGVAMHGQADGSSLLLPTYELVNGDGAIWTVVAVADRHFDFSSGR